MKSFSDYLHKIHHQEIKKDYDNTILKIEKKYEILFHHNEKKIEEYDNEFTKMKSLYEKEIETLSSIYSKYIEDKDYLLESDIIDIYTEKKDNLDNTYLINVKKLLDKQEEVEKYLIKLSKDKENEIKKVKEDMERSLSSPKENEIRKKEINLKRKSSNEINDAFKKIRYDTPSRQLKIKVINVLQFTSHSQIFVKNQHNQYDNLIGYYTGFLRDDKVTDYEKYMINNDLYNNVYDRIHKYIVRILSEKIEEIKVCLSVHDKVIINFNHERHYGLYKYQDIYGKEVIISFRTVLKTINPDVIKHKLKLIGLIDVNTKMIDTSEYCGFEIKN